MKKLKEVDWKTKGGKVLKETALISEAVAGWTPVGGVLKYLANKGADMLVPPVTNEEIKRLLEQLQNVPESVTDVRRREGEDSDAAAETVVGTHIDDSDS